ncbi:MAG TPA: hypothetical protein VMT43_09505, partial [Acidimicrobiales bacterium]|nr:hypothetical protein [Acidimicrobiales bacterium]
SARSDGEPVHPQVVAENAPDSEHFHYVHHATVHPVREAWEIDGPILRFVAGWPDVRRDEPGAMALRIHSHHNGLGVAISAFTGAQNHRLVFACTPDEHLGDLVERIAVVTERMGGAAVDLTLDDLCRSPIVAVGPLDEVCEKLTRTRDRFGLNYFAAPVGARPELMAPVIERLAGTSRRYPQPPRQRHRLPGHRAPSRVRAPRRRE